MIGASVRKRAGGLVVIAALLAITVGLGCGGEDDPNPNPTPLASAPGDYFVTKFILTNTGNAQDVVDGDSFGLSVFFTLNADGTLSGSAQVPQEPPDATALNGTWTLDGDGNFSMTFTDEQGLSRTLQGSLDFDADGDVVFIGSQTAGDPIQIGDAGQLYNISSIEMSKYPDDVSNEDFAGTWVAISGIAFKNTDPNVTEDLLAEADTTLIFNANGTVEVRNTFEGGGEDNFVAPYTILDDFHFDITIDGEVQTVVYGLVDDVLTLYIYEGPSQTFPGDSVSSPSTQVFVFERQ